MSWWYVSSERITGAVQVEEGIVTWAPPVMKRFVGQPSKNLGNWMRALGGFEFSRLVDLTHIYSWGNNEKRVTMKNRPCRVLARGAMRSVLIEFADGQREVVSARALRILR